MIESVATLGPDLTLSTPSSATEHEREAAMRDDRWT